MEKPEHPKIYLISGLGGDGRLFQRLEEEGLQFEPIEFLRPEPKESWRHYAKRMAASIDQSEPFIIGGVSFGGMLATEISAFTQPEMTLLISSVKHTREFPFYLKIFRFLPIHRLLSGEFIKKIAPAAPARMIGRENRVLLDLQKQDADPVFIKWAVNQAVWFRNRNSLANYVHIHGSRDFMLPGIFVRDKISVPGGDHVMVTHRAPEIVEIIHQEIAKRHSPA